MKDEVRQLRDCAPLSLSLSLVMLKQVGIFIILPFQSGVPFNLSVQPDHAIRASTALAMDESCVAETA